MASVRLKLRDLRAGLALILGLSIVIALILANWGPTFRTNDTVIQIALMGYTFVPVLAAFSLTLLFTSFAFEAVSGD